MAEGAAVGCFPHVLDGDNGDAGTFGDNGDGYCTGNFGDLGCGDNGDAGTLQFSKFRPCGLRDCIGKLRLVNNSRKAS